jgi:hypothetical protein|tara:strand:- start:754 stop:927 length:174 start_codon:yes stop_codon:yes gene_type:complete
MNVIKNNVAELILALITIIVLTSSCGSTSGLCPAYSQETSQEVFYASLDCQNCDEVD